MNQGKHRKFRSFAAFLLAVVLCLTLAVPAMAADDATASSIQLAKTEGTVSAANSAGRSISLVKNLRLFSGYHVKTEAKSYAWLNLDSAKLLKEDASSNVEVRKSGKKMEVLLSSGNLFFNVTEPLDDDETLNIRTSTTLTGVRGTCGWVEVIDRWNTDVYILEGEVECVVTDPVSGEDELTTISAGETATFTVRREGTSATNGVEISKKRCDVDDVPGYVLVELAEDRQLCNDIRDASGLDILGELSRNGDPAGEARRLLEEDEAADASRLASIAAREQAQASNVESAPNSSGTADTPVIPEPAIPGDLTMAGTWGWKYDAGSKTLYISGSGAMDDFYSSRVPWLDHRQEIESVVIGEGITYIGNNAFYQCFSLTRAVIPSSVTGIGQRAFIYCNKLADVTVPSGVTSIGEYAFSGCRGLTSVTIPSGMTSIETGVFQACTGLTSVTIPSSVTSIGVSAFNGCYGLTSVTIPNSVTIIEERAFESCTGLTGITIPSRVTSIGKQAFHACDSLASVTIPSSVTSIENFAFWECPRLTSLTIPDSVTSIGHGAFADTGLTSITIPSSITSIGTQTFLNCNSLTSITIPSSVTSIEGGVFSNCSSLADVYYGGNAQQWSAITIGLANEALDSAAIHYNSR